MAGKTNGHWSTHLIGGMLFFGGYRLADSLGLGPVVSSAILGFSALLVVIAGIGFVREWRWRRALGPMTEPSGLYGTAFDPDVEDATSFGLVLDNPDNHAFLIAGKEGRLLYCETDSHVCILGPSGTGKTASVSTPIALSLNTNAIFTGKGIELYLAARKWRKDVFGHEVRHWNPYNLGGVGCDNINLLADLFPFIERNDPEAIEIAKGKSLLLVPKPKDSGGDNAFFPLFAGGFLGPAMNYFVWLEIETGEPVGNLPTLYRRLCGSIDDFRGFLFQMERCDGLEGSIALAAKRFISLLTTSPKTAMSVLGVISNALDSFDPASKIGKSITRSDFDVHGITHKKMSIFFSNKPDKVQDSPAVGLAVEMFIGISLRDQRKNRRVVHFILDEFGNLCGGPIPGVGPMLYLGRSLKTRGIFFVQSTSIFDRYDEPGAFISQSACFLATAIRDVDDAEFLSKRSGQFSAIVESTSLPVSNKRGMSDDYSIGLSEQAVPTRRPDQVLQMKDYTGLLFYRQNPPIEVDLVHYQSVDQWRDYAEKNADIQLDNVPVKYRLNV